MKPRTAALAVVLTAVVITSCGGGGYSDPRTRLVLEPEEGVVIMDDLDSALDGSMKVIERRLDQFDVDGARVERVGGDRIAIEVPGTRSDEIVSLLSRPFLLQFCDPEMDSLGNVAVLREGTVQYKPQSCDPVRDENGDIIVEGGRITYEEWNPDIRLFSNDEIIWTPATAELDGVETALSGEFLKPTTYVDEDILGQPRLIFEWNEKGAEISGKVTERLSDGNYPLALFLDGDPIHGEDGDIIAPSVRSVIYNTGEITSLSIDEAEELSALLNTGAFPMPMRVVEMVEVKD